MYIISISNTERFVTTRKSLAISRIRLAQVNWEVNPKPHKVGEWVPSTSPTILFPAM